MVACGFSAILEGRVAVMVDGSFLRGLSQATILRWLCPAYIALVAVNPHLIQWLQERSHSSRLVFSTLECIWNPRARTVPLPTPGWVYRRENSEAIGGDRLYSRTAFRPRYGEATLVPGQPETIVVRARNGCYSKVSLSECVGKLVKEAMLRKTESASDMYPL